MTRLRLLLSAAWVLAMGLPSAARANDDEIFGANAERVEDADLSELRGGFVYEGVDIKFGAELRSYISDELVVQTNISWHDELPQVTTMVAPGVTPISAGDLQNLLGGTGLSSQLGVGGAYLANEGQTAFIQLAGNGLQNVILNTANDVAIRQELDATFDVSNFGPFQADMLAGQIGQSMGSMIGLAGIGN